MKETHHNTITIPDNNSNSSVFIYDDNSNQSTKSNSTELYIYGLNRQQIVNILYGFVALSVLTVIVNVWVLKSLSSAQLGHSTILVFIRSLCVSDVLIGLFGVFKSLQLQNFGTIMFNCFLPESVFVSASIATCLTLLWLNTETYLRLDRPFCLVIRMNKHNTSLATVFLWNVSFILGFLPHMGWNNEEFVCDLFFFYPSSYIASVSLIWLISIVGCTCYHVLLYKTRERIRQSRNFISSNSLEFKQYNHLCIMLNHDIIIFILCYLPCLTYILIHSINYRHQGNMMVNVNLVFFLPLFMVRSLVTALIHRYRTVCIQKLLGRVNSALKTQQHSVRTRGSDDNLSVPNSPGNNDCPANSGTSTVYTINGRTVSSTIERTHQPLSAQSSNITIVTVEGDISESQGTNL